MSAWLPDFTDRIRRLVGILAPALSSDRRDDVIQDASKRYIEKLPTLRNPESRISFLNGIARNTLKEHLRKHREDRDRYQSLEGMYDVFDPAAEHSSVELHLDTDQSLRSVMTAILTLPPLIRDTLVLRVLKENTVREVAEVLGCSIGAVCENEQRAWLMLHDPLGFGYLMGNVFTPEDLPVFGAAVRISSGMTKTTRKGEFLLKFLKPGGWSLKVEATGYLTHNSDVPIVVGRNEIGPIVLWNVVAAAT